MLGFFLLLFSIWESDHFLGQGVHWAIVRVGGDGRARAEKDPNLVVRVKPEVEVDAEREGTNGWSDMSQARRGLSEMVTYKII